MSRDDWVSASAAGRAAFCGKSVELQARGASVSEKARKARIKGEKEHDRFNAEIKSQTADRRCFIASHVYGIDDPRTEALRRFRDSRLMPSKPGRLLVRIYYALSPAAVRMCKRCSVLDSMARRVVAAVLTCISDRE